MNFNEKLKELRKQKGYSRKELATKADLSPITIEKYEQGSREPTVEYAERLAEALNVEPIELIQTLKSYKSFGDYIFQKQLSREESLMNLSKDINAYPDEFFFDLQRLFNILDVNVQKEFSENYESETAKRLHKLVLEYISLIEGASYQNFENGEWVENEKVQPAGFNALNEITQINMELLNPEVASLNKTDED